MEMVVKDINAEGDVTIIGPGGTYHKTVLAAWSPVVVIPRQLPPAPLNLVGRETELQEAEKALSPLGCAALVLRGMGGVGKSALATKLCHRLAPRFPDGQIYLDMLGASATPRTPASALALAIRSFYPMLAPPEELEALAALYRSLLAGKRLLLLLDNASGPKQIEPLLPPSGCALVVTARSRIGHAGFIDQELFPLAPRDAELLLLAICPRMVESAAAVARLSGGLPLALQANAGALATNPLLEPEALIAHLQETGERLKFVEASFDVSYRLLDTVDQARWRKLSVFASPFLTEAAEFVWGDQDHSHQGLNTLHAASLVAKISAVGRFQRFQLHDLTRDYLRTRMTLEEHESAMRRLVTFCVMIVHSCAEFHLKGGLDTLRGLYLLDQELANIEEAHRWAEKMAVTDEGLAEACMGLTLVGGQLFAFRLPPRLFIEWLEHAVAIAERLGRPAEEAVLRAFLVDALNAIDASERALSAARALLALALKTQRPAHKAMGLAALGESLTATGSPLEAMKLHWLQLRIAREIKDPGVEAEAEYGLGKASLSEGDLTQALKHFRRFHELVKDSSDWRLEARSRACLANLHTRIVLCSKTRTKKAGWNLLTALRNFRTQRAFQPLLGKAIVMLGHRLQIARGLRDRVDEGLSLGDLGRAYAVSGDATAAVEHLRGQLQIAQEIGNRRLEASTLLDLSWVHRSRGRTTDAEDAAREAAQVLAALNLSPDSVRGTLEEWEKVFEPSVSEGSDPSE